MADRLTLAQRRNCVSNIKSKAAVIEITLRGLQKCGCRYHVNYKILFGKQDIASTKYKIAILRDSESSLGKARRLLLWHKYCAATIVGFG